MSGENFTTTGKWPGDAVTATKTIDGKKWYYKTYRIAKRDNMISFVFNTNSGNTQTINVYDLKKDTYIEISDEKDSQKHYTIKDVTDQISIDSFHYKIDGRKTR